MVRKAETRDWAYNSERKYFFPYPSQQRYEFIENLNTHDELVIYLALLTSRARHRIDDLEEFGVTELPENMQGYDRFTHMVPMPPMMFDISGEHHLRVLQSLVE